MKNKTTQENKPVEAVNYPNGVNENKAPTPLEETPVQQEGISPDSVKNTPPPPLCLDEVKLMVDALNGTGWWVLLTNSKEMDRFVNSDGSKLGCCGLVGEIEDAIALDGLDEKWEVDGLALVQKLRNMPPDLRRKLALGIAEFWERPNINDQADTVLERLRGQLNRELSPQGAVGVVEATLAPVTQN